MKDDGLLTFIFTKFCEFLSELVLAVMFYQKILILKGPSMRQVKEILILVKNRKFLKSLKTYFIISSFEISLSDIFISPGPFLSKIILSLHLEEKLLNLDLKFPERSSTFDIIIKSSPIEYIQKTESIKYSMVATKIRRELLIAFTLMNVVVLVVYVGYEMTGIFLSNMDGRSSNLRNNLV